MPLAILAKFCVCAAMHSERIVCLWCRSNSIDCLGSDHLLSPVVVLKKNWVLSPNSGASSGPCGASCTVHSATASTATWCAWRKCMSLRAKIASRGSSGGQQRTSSINSRKSSDCGCSHMDSPVTRSKKYPREDSSSSSSDQCGGRAAANMWCAATMTRPLASTRGSTPTCPRKFLKSQKRKNCKPSCAVERWLLSCRLPGPSCA
mmetsp:Transcript_56520/g.163936  ORF Transcript_56520/g.163936 Transcript_56520/m.163936 type:complete len:205 (-) Transcript_56520:99-713(-)